MSGRINYSNLIAAIATISACDIALGFTFQLLPLLMEQRHIPASIIGLNTAMGPLGILLAGPFLPRLIGAIGAKRAAFGAIAVVITALVIFKSTSSLYVWFPLRFLFGICTGTLFTVSEAWILTFAGDGNRGKVMGVYTSVMAITFSIGPFLLPLTGTDSWLPWLIGILCLCASILPLTLVDVSTANFQHDGAADTGYWSIVKTAPLLLFAVCAATLFDSVFISFFTIFGLRSGLDLATASRLLGVGIIGNLLFQFAIGIWSDRWSRIGVIVITALLTILTSLSLPALINTWAIWPVVIVLATAAFAVYVIALAIMGDTFKGPQLVACSAAFSSMWGVGGLVGPSLAGAGIDAFGVNAMPVLLALIYAVLVIGLALNRGQLVRKVPA
jgi:MFS family permease